MNCENELYIYICRTFFVTYEKNKKIKIDLGTFETPILYTQNIKLMLSERQEEF